MSVEEEAANYLRQMRAGEGKAPALRGSASDFGKVQVQPTVMPASLTGNLIEDKNASDWLYF